MVHENPEQKSDALVRAWRTFGQGAAVAVLASVGKVLINLGDAPDWRLTLGLVGSAAGTAVVTYLHNKLSPVG